MLFAEYGALSRCPECNSALASRSLFGIPAVYRPNVEKLIAHALIYYQGELDKEAKDREAESEANHD
jgi:hypothetical protein